MSPHHPDGVTELLHRASDDLAPDLDRLVSGGIARGRSRQRRARIGTTVASLAVIGVIGAVAAVVPHVGGADSARDPGIADDGGVVATEAPSPTPDPDPAPAELTVSAPEIPGAVAGILDLSDVSSPLVEPPYGIDDSPGSKVVSFRVSGMLVTAVMERATGAQGGQDTLLSSSWGPSAADGVTAQGASVRRDGYAISFTAYNAADGKESPELQADPVLTIQQMQTLAGSDVWFE